MSENSRSPFDTVTIAIGIAIYTAAGLVLFALGETLGTAIHGLVLAIAVLVALPIPLTAWFVRAYRRVDSKATFLGNAPGVAALVALASIAVLAVFARPTLARVAEHAARSHPGADLAGGRRLNALARWLRPAPATHPAPIEPHHDESLVARPDAAALMLDASVVDGSTAPRDADSSARSSVEFAICGQRNGWTVAPVAVHPGEPERIWVSCLGDFGQLYAIASDGSIRLTTEVQISPPPSIPTSYLSSAIGADLDADGIGDLATCAKFESERAGSRGGAVVWFRMQPDGTFAEPARLFETNCAGLAAADIDGHPGVELIAVDYGNPFAANRSGHLLVYSGRAARWRRTFQLAIDREPDYSAFLDVDHDGSLDVLVGHDLGRLVPVVYRGHAGQFAAGDQTLVSAAPERATHMLADLDGDGRRNDRVEFTFAALNGAQWAEHGLRIERDGPLHAPTSIEPAQSLEYQAH